MEWYNDSMECHFSHDYVKMGTVSVEWDATERRGTGSTGRG
jgi:hypothetical protein